MDPAIESARIGMQRVTAGRAKPVAGVAQNARTAPRLVVISSLPRHQCAGMRVTFVNRYYYPDISATSQMLYDLTRRLAREGIEVSVVCSRQRYDDPHANLPKYEIIEGVHVHRVRSTRFGRGGLVGRGCDYASFYPSAAFKLLEVVKTGDVVVAKTDPPLISVVAAAVAQWRGAKLINWLQDVFPEVASRLGHKMPKWLDAYLARLRDRSLQFAQVNVAIGTRMQEYLLRRGIKAERIQVIENWADADSVESKPASDSQLRTRLGLQGKFVVGYSGNLGRAHEFETLLQAAVLLRDESDIVFLMVGGGAKMALLKERVAALKLSNVVFLPYQPRELLADSLAAADVHLACLLPALEGLIVPSKFYGILAAGRPTIFIGDLNGELGRILQKECCGKMVSVGDYDSLITEIWRMKQDDDYRHKAGIRARVAFVERYTAERGTQKWLEILSELQADQVGKVAGALAPNRVL